MIKIEEYKDKEDAYTLHYGTYTDEFGTELEFTVHETLADEHQPFFLVKWETETPQNYDEVEERIVESLW
jgi:hypothetical protein